MHHPFRHEALPYRGMEQFVALAVTMLRDALDRDERPLLLVEPARLEQVRETLGPDIASVALVPINEHGRNPSRLLTMIHSFMLAGNGQRTLALSEPTLVRHGAPARAEVALAESVLNSTALSGWPTSVVCMYDGDTVGEAEMSEVRRSHPVVRGESADNADYDPDRLHELYGAHLPPPPESVRSMDIGGAQLGRMREVVHAAASSYGIAPDRVDDLVLAANEIVTNSVRHADGRCVLRIWFDGASAVCEVADHGYLADPLVGRLAPDPARSDGRGLWLAHHLCDLVQIRSSAAGTVVRLFVDC